MVTIGLAFVAMGLPAILLVWRDRSISDDD